MPHRKNTPSARPKTDPEVDFWDLDSNLAQPSVPQPAGDVPVRHKQIPKPPHGKKTSQAGPEPIESAHPPDPEPGDTAPSEELVEPPARPEENKKHGETQAPEPADGPSETPDHPALPLKKSQAAKKSSRTAGSSAGSEASEKEAPGPWKPSKPKAQPDSLEEEFLPLDPEPAPPKSSHPDPKATPPPKKKVRPANGSPPDEPSPPPAKPQPADRPEPAHSREPAADSESPALPSTEVPIPNTGTEKSGIEPNSEPASRPPNPTPTRRFSLLEKASLVAFLLLIAGAITWGALLLLKPSDWKSEFAGDPDLSATGTHATVANVESWWRKPVRSGEGLDPGVRPNIRLIPEARVSLGGTQSGAIRFVFQDDRGQRVGDPVTLAVENGRFLTNSEPAATIICTEGFEEPALLNVYAQGQLKPWELLVYEAKDDRSDDFQLLLTHEISSQFQP